MRTAEIELADDVVEQRWTEVLEAIRTKKPYAIAPWHPLPGEPRLAQLAFNSYRDSSQRNLALTASTMAMPFAQIKDLANLYNWSQRAEMYDEWSERQGDDAHAEMVAKTQRDTAAAFSRLPALASSAFQLVEGAVNDKLAKQAERIERGKINRYDDDGRRVHDDDEDNDAVSLTQATRLAEIVRGLLDATTRFLGVKIAIEHTHRGVVGHIHTNAIEEQDAIRFLQGLTEAGFDVGAIEAEASG